MSSVNAIESLLAALRQAQALRPAQLEELEQSASQFSEPRALAQHLLEKNWLTPFQINQLVRGGDLVLGPYLLLERLGEGHSGQVYKARHQRMNRVVALKAIRKELVSDEAGLARFYQEVEAASRLTHPNVIHAFDAGPMGPTHCLVREYVDGIDLSRLIQQRGPMPVPQACQAIYQAALGLHHAHEHRMQHGAIKPSKLLLTQVPDGEGRLQPVIKLLDVGLASLYQSSDGHSLHGRLRDLGVGTTDYLAPEQLNDGQSVDIRTDIYGLGCAFYYILTGQAPFSPGQADRTQVKPVEELRADVPAPVASVVQKMMAADPAQRYAAPMEVAQALADFVGDDAREVFRGLLDEPSAVRRQEQTWARWPVLAGGLLLLVGLLCLFILLINQKGKERERTSPTEPLVLPHWLDGKRIPPAERAKVPQLIDLANVLRHGPGPVRSLSFSLKDNLVATAGEEGLVKVWDWKTGNEIAALTGHGRPVLAVDFSPDGKALASGARDKKIRIWDGVNLLGEERNIPVETEWINVVAFSPDQKYLLAKHKNTELRLWELPGYKAGPVLGNNNKKINAAAFASDSKTVALASEEKLVRVHDLTKGTKALHVLKGHGKEVNAVAFSPDGKTLLSGSDDLTVRIWDPLTGFERGILSKHSLSVGRVVVSPDGVLVASSGGDQVILWRLADQQVVKDWRLPGPVNDLVFSPNGYLLCACDNGAVYIIRLPA